MKKTTTINAAVLFGVALLVLACRKEGVGLYNLPDDIYFSTRAGIHDIGTTNVVDFTFAYGEEGVLDTVFPILVSVTGPPRDYDRPFAVEVAGTTTAQAGVHYELLTARQRIGAGQVTDTLFVKLNRLPDLKDTPVTLALNLSPNEHFDTRIVSVLPYPDFEGTLLPSHAFQLNFSDIAITPPLWNDWAFGGFSVKKLDLLTVLTDKTRPFFLEERTYEMLMLQYTYSIVLHRYLVEQDAAGTPILEDDGTPMVSGGYATN